MGNKTNLNIWLVMSIFLLRMVCTTPAVLSVDDVSWILGESSPDDWSIEPETPTTSDVINFSGPTAIFPNGCVGEIQMSGTATLTIDPPTKTIELWFQPPPPEYCPYLWEPVCGLEGSFGPLEAGQWVFIGTIPWPDMEWDTFWIPFEVVSESVVCYVDADGSADFETIQEAIDNSNNGDEIVVAEATHIENINFNGKNIILRSKDPNDSAVVAATVIDGNNANSVVTFSGTEDSNCVLSGFTITRGKKGMPLYVDIQDIFGDVEPNWIGWDDDEFPISLSADFDDNFSATLEYGWPFDNGDWQTEYPPGPDIADVLEDGYRRLQDGDIITLTFSDLKAGDYFIVTYHVDMDDSGGTTEGTFKVFVDGEVAFDYAVTIGRDSLPGPDGTTYFGFTSDGVNDVVIEFDGEAVEPDVDEVWLNGFALKGEGPLRSGGGIAGNGCSATISNCVITENWANEGGGVYDCDGLIENNVVIDNEADKIRPPYGPIGGIGIGGGLSGCDGTIAGNMISGNYAFSGGGLDSCGGTVINNLLVDNFAVHGGALNKCNGIINNCTVVGNRNVGLDGCTGTITNCIIWQNLNQLSDCNVPSYSCIEGWGGGGIGNISTDPCFADPCNVDYHLQAWSSCIDAGDNTAVPGGVTTDLDGRDRIADGDCNDTIIVDMGTYEFTYAYFGDFDGQCDVDFVDYAILANYWMTDEFLVDIAPTPAGDGIVDEKDLAVQCEHWLFGK